MRILFVSRLFTSVVVPFILLGAIFWVQTKIPHEIALFPFYMLPVAKFTWEFGWRGAWFGIILASSLWLLGSILSGQPYSFEWIRYYNAGVRSLVFIVVAVFILLFRRVVEQHRRRMEAMRALLNVCHGCGSLQGSDGKWIRFEELTPDSVRKLRECPSCAAAAKDSGRR